MKTWRECFFEPRQLASDKWDHYFDIYERCFNRHRVKSAPMYLEIGCQRGGSLETARRYFGDQAKIYGIDVDPKCHALNAMPFIDKVFIGSQADPQFLDAVARETGALDIVVNDGSHESFDMVVSFLVLFPHLANHGTYLIEDTCCAYFANYRKLFHGLTVVDYFKGLADKLSLNMRREELIDTRYRVPPNQRDGRVQQKVGLIKDIWSIAFYDSVIVIEKTINDSEPMRNQV